MKIAINIPIRTECDGNVANLALRDFANIQCCLTAAPDPHVPNELASH